MRQRRVAGAIGLVAAALVLAACSDTSSSDSPEPTPTAAPTVSPVKTPLTFGVYGSIPEIAAYAQMSETFDSLESDVTVDVLDWRAHDGLRRAVDRGEALPDVFMISRRDLAWYLENELNRPVDTLLDERGVDFGDGYSRSALTAFSADNRLQCMPYGVAPDLVFYNTDLVDWTRMKERGLDVPSSRANWSFDEFTAAADFAARPHQGIAGVYIEPTLNGLAPFIHSGSGDVFNDATDPTSLAFSSDGTRSALERTLTLLRDPKVTLSQAQIERRSALEWFKRGRLAMMVGTRALVPDLRTAPGVNFDVMAMPRLEERATVGDITGLCMAQDTESPTEAADFLLYATSSEAVSDVVHAGYLQPANQEVALSRGFLQPSKEPVSSPLFNYAANSLVVPPVLDDWDELETVIQPYVEQLFYSGPTLDLDGITERIDAASVPILDPESLTESPSPTTEE